MPRWVLFAIWGTLATAITAATHYYIWTRLVRDTHLTGAAQLVGTIALIILGLSLPAAMIFGRVSHAPVAKMLVWTAFVWMGTMFFVIVLLGTGDFLRFLGSGAVRLAQAGAGPEDPERRRFFSRLFGGGVALTTGLASAWALRGGLMPAELKQVGITLRRWPEVLRGYKILQISDLHVGPTIGQAEVEALVERTNGQSPDLIVITGDLVDGSVNDLRAAVAPLGRLRARHGVFFVTGNHEYYSGAPAWCAELGRLGIRVLRNEHVVLGEGAGRFVLAGVDDPTAGRIEPGHGTDIPAALAGRDESLPVVLLSHQPRTIDEAAAHRVDLQLSGHTHGGQIFPFSLLVRLASPYVAGLHQHTELTQIYVSRGTGYWGPPMRLAAPSELTVLSIV